jgi:hypothetical protein
LHGVKDATSDEETVPTWWERWPDANVGIATGLVSGLIALDVDPRHGGDNSLADLERRHGPLPDTPRVITGGNGLHLYFRIDRPLGNRVAFAPGLDFRGDGGFVVAPPSLHVSGQRYIWEETAHHRDLALAVMPAWLLDLVEQPSRDQLQRDGTPLVICEGERNRRLFQLACVQRRYGLNAKAIRAYLDIVNREHVQPPLGAAELEKIAVRAATYEPADVTHYPRSAHLFPRSRSFEDALAAVVRRVRGET